MRTSTSATCSRARSTTCERRGVGLRADLRAEHGRDGPDAGLHERHVRRFRRRSGTAGRAADGCNAEGYENLVDFQKRLRRDDLSLTHTIVHPTVDKEADDVFTDNPVPLHKVGETDDSIIVRGARLLATLAPFADEQTVYPGTPLPAEAPPEYALSFTVAMDTPGLVFLCRDSGMRPDAHPLDAPFSTAFDEQDALCLFDDVHVPKAQRVHRRQRRRLQLGDGAERVVAEHHAADHASGP